MPGIVFRKSFDQNKTSTQAGILRNWGRHHQNSSHFRIVGNSEVSVAADLDEWIIADALSEHSRYIGEAQIFRVPGRITGYSALSLR